MNTCKSCIHWQWPYPPDGNKHLCCHPKVGIRSGTPKEDGADIENGNEATGIITGPDFGCVHWEQK